MQRSLLTLCLLALLATVMALPTSNPATNATGIFSTKQLGNHTDTPGMIRVCETSQASPTVNDLQWLAWALYERGGRCDLPHGRYQCQNKASSGSASINVCGSGIGLACSTLGDLVLQTVHYCTVHGRAGAAFVNKTPYAKIGVFHS